MHAHIQIFEAGKPMEVMNAGLFDPEISHTVTVLLT